MELGALEALFDGPGDVIDVAAFDRHAPVGERAHAVVVPAGERQGQAGHAKRDGVGVFLEVDAALTVLLGWSEDELVSALLALWFARDHGGVRPAGWRGRIGMVNEYPALLGRHRHRGDSFPPTAVRRHDQRDA